MNQSQMPLERKKIVTMSTMAFGTFMPLFSSIYKHNEAINWRQPQRERFWLLQVGEHWASARDLDAHSLLWLLMALATLPPLWAAPHGAWRRKTNPNLPGSAQKPAALPSQISMV